MVLLIRYDQVDFFYKMVSLIRYDQVDFFIATSWKIKHNNSILEFVLFI